MFEVKKSIWKHETDERINDPRANTDHYTLTGATLAQVTRSGETKFAINSGPATVASRSQGADAIIIAAAVNKLPYSLITAKSITKWASSLRAPLSCPGYIF